MTGTGRLVWVVTAMAVVTSLFHTVLAPLLPAFERNLGLSKTEAGILVAMFPLGLSVASLPVTLAVSRISVKRLALGSMIMLGGASVAFGLVHSYAGLLAVRWMQGAAAGISISSGLAWLVGSSPRERRAELIGLTSGARSAGQVLGPTVGVAGAAAGRTVAFLGIGAVAIGVAVLGRLLPSPAPDAGSGGRVPSLAGRAGTLVGSLWPIVVPGLLLGTLAVLAPLHLDRLGWGAGRVGATFLLAAALGIVARPWIGRWADAFGLGRALSFLLLVSVPVTIAIPWLRDGWAVAVLAVLASTVYGVMIGPTMARASLAFEELGVAQAIGFAVMVLVGGLGLAAGSTLSGSLAEAVGDEATYLVLAAISVATAAGLGRPAARCQEDG